MIRMEVEPTQSKTVAQKRGKCMTIDGTEIYAATAMKRKEHYWIREDGIERHY